VTTILWRSLPIVRTTLILDMDVAASATIRRVIARAPSDPAVLAVILFGRAVRGEASAASDVDVCVVLDPDVPSGLPAAR
jgi:predicted nucleotidyltransferase